MSPTASTPTQALRPALQPDTSGPWSLADLPSPPPGRHGWPWDRAPDTLRARTPKGNAWPRVTVVTPSYNQGQYLEATIRSVLLQGYANLDYWVIDGGSTDELTHEVLERYRPFLSGCVSEPDRGQADAITKGFARSDGSIMNFLNSDDWFEPGAIAAAAERLTDDPELGVVYGTALFTDAEGVVLRPYETQPFDPATLVANNYIGQPSLFHRRSVWDQAGGLDTRWNFVLDYALWLKWASEGVRFTFDDRITAYYRLHGESKSCQLMRTNQDETLRLLESYRQHPRMGPLVQDCLPRRTYEFAMWSYAQLDLAQFRRMAWRYCVMHRRRPNFALGRRAAMSLLGRGVLRRLRRGVYGQPPEALA